jgi:DNA-directed RNA polymerase subunit RPC12/RpoP
MGMKKINEWFKCVNCWFEVPPASKTCRNHCPKCFVSIHVDDKIPGDRKSNCWWVMYPIDYKISNWEIKILFKCSKCWKLHWNKAADDDEISELPYLIYNYKEYI